MISSKSLSSFFFFFQPKIKRVLRFHHAPLREKTISLTHHATVVCIFVSDEANGDILRQLYANGVRLLLLRCAGYDMVDLDVAEELGLIVLNIPDYSPHAVAEHTVGLMLTLNRHICRAYNRTRDQNFCLRGLVGFDMDGKTVGIIGTGTIGTIVAKICNGTMLFFIAKKTRKLKTKNECRNGVQYRSV